MTKLDSESPKRQQRLQKLGDALRNLREAKGWSPYTAAQKSWPHGTVDLAAESRARLVRRWENGEVEPTGLLLDQYLKIYEKDPSLGALVEQAATQYQLRWARVRRTTAPGREFHPLEGGELTIPQAGGASLGTGWTILGGTPEYPYTLDSITMRLDPIEIQLPDDLVVLRDEMAKEIERKRALGASDIWNERRFSLRRITHTRQAEAPDMGLTLDVQLTDYAAFAGITLKMDIDGLVSDEKGSPISIRQKYFGEFDSEKPNPYLTRSFGINILVISADDRALFVERSKRVVASPGQYNISVNEGMQHPRDMQFGNPSVLVTTQAGLFEELGIADIYATHAARVEVLSFGVVHRKNQYALLACLDLPYSSDEIHRMFVIRAKDRPLEVRRLYAVPFEFQSLMDFVESHGPWAGHGLATLYLTIARRWGYDETERLLKERPISASVVVA